MDGKVIGSHKGIIHYTIGQRKGLGLNLGRPGFVVDINPETRDITIGTNDDVFSPGCIVDRLNFMSIEKVEGEMEFTAKVRYSHQPDKCKIRMVGKTRWNAF